MKGWGVFIAQHFWWHTLYLAQHHFCLQGSNISPLVTPNRATNIMAQIPDQQRNGRRPWCMYLEVVSPFNIFRCVYVQKPAGSHTEQLDNECQGPNIFNNWLFQTVPLIAHQKYFHGSKFHTRSLTGGIRFRFRISHNKLRDRKWGI